ncbi:hypothetical protein [Marinovum sp.]|uniref:hypothetical protein n=1 Tax=Marinovum sp. TaxID=2024839 RepID=UPI002B274DC0|nr:hypothetical protein [Marinovum sp.]
MTRNTPKSNLTSKYRAPGNVGVAHAGPLDVTWEEDAATASAIAHPPSARPTHVTVRYDGATLSIAATYEPKWRGSVAASISLPLDLKDPSPLLPLLEGEQPWKAWPEIESLVRQATVDLRVPRRLIRVFDLHLRVLRAVRNGPEVSKMLSYFSTDKARTHALFMKTDWDVNSMIEGCLIQMRRILDTGSTDTRILSAFSGAVRYYQELLHEKQRRACLSERERMSEMLRRCEEEDRSRRRRKDTKSHRS